MKSEHGDYRQKSESEEDASDGDSESQIAGSDDDCGQMTALSFLSRERNEKRVLSDVDLDSIKSLSAHFDDNLTVAAKPAQTTMKTVTTEAADSSESDGGDLPGGPMWPLGLAELQAASNVSLKHFVFPLTGTEHKMSKHSEQKRYQNKGIRTFGCDHHANCDT